jgi:hypothetical protein
MQIRAKEMINETWEGLEDPAVFIMRVRRFTILPPTVGWMRMDLRLSCSKEQASTSCGDADFAPYPGTHRPLHDTDISDVLAPSRM